MSHEGPNFPAAIGGWNSLMLMWSCWFAFLRDSYPCHTKTEEEPENYPNADGKPDGPASWNACTNKQEAQDYHGDNSCNDIATPYGNEKGCEWTSLCDTEEVQALRKDTRRRGME